MDTQLDIGEIETKLLNLEGKLREYCIRSIQSQLGSFLLMFNEEEGRNIRYAKDMEMSEMGMTMEFYDRNSECYNSENDPIVWPYTGFVQGHDELPISISDLAEWLKESPYLEPASLLRKNFITYFEGLI